jgi:hypothetical protein
MARHEILAIKPSSTSRNSLAWVLEPLEDEPTYLRKRMFGCEAAYVFGLMVLLVADRDEPWNGLMVCTSKKSQAALIDELPALQVHPVIGKWLYISQENPEFETIAERLVDLALQQDPRFGVEPRPRKKTARAMKTER